MNSDQLRSLLREQAESLSKETAQANGRISDKQVEALERLARVVEICDKTRPPKTRKRWPVVVILGISLLLVSVLLFARLRSTEIELDLKLIDLRFVLSRRVLLADKMLLSALGVSELREIHLPPTHDRDVQTFKSPEGRGISIRLSVVETEDGNPQGTITLTSLLLPAGTKVEVNCTEIPDQYRLSLEVPEGEELNLQVNVHGIMQVVRPGVPAEQLDYSIPDAIRMQPASQQVILDLTLHSGTQEAFSSHLSSKNLAFTRIEQYMDTDKAYIHRVPTVLSGSLYLAELNGQKYPLREGEDLRFNLSDGQIRTLKLDKNQLILKFHGHVGGMTTGWEKIRVNLMPTWLAWLRARHGLGLLWGTTLFLFGLINRIIRWWKGG